MANTWTTLLDAVYPVGAVYQSWSSTSPATLFGGTWTQITELFLYANAEAGITGGSTKHIHAAGNLAAAIGATNSTQKQIGYIAVSRSDYFEDSPTATYRVDGTLAGSYDGYFNHFTAVYGGTDFGSSIPPCVSCYTWRRTA